MQTISGDLPRTCQELGAVENPGYRSGSVNWILRRNRAGALGATHLRRVPGSMVLDGSMAVVAYRCPETPAGATAP